MPGRKYRSIKRPRVYEALKKKRGMFKAKAAAISNAGTSKTKRKRMARKAGRRR